MNWNVTVAPIFHRFGFWHEYKEANFAPETGKDNFTEVDSMDYQIHTVDEKKLWTQPTNNIYSVYLCAKGYDPKGNLTHTGLASLCEDDDALAENFMDALRKKVDGKIELSIVGYGEYAESTVDKVMEIAKNKKIAVTDEINSKRLARNYYLIMDQNQIANRTNPKSESTFEKIYFNEDFAPSLHMELKFPGTWNRATNQEEPISPFGVATLSAIGPGTLTDPSPFKLVEQDPFQS